MQHILKSLINTLFEDSYVKKKNTLKTYAIFFLTPGP